MSFVSTERDHDAARRGSGHAAAAGDLPAPPWSRRRVKPERPALSPDAIVDAALRVLDEHGIDGLSMRRVADALGTGPASLYAHVSGKEELLELMIDRVAAELDVPDPDPERWQEQVKDGVRAVYHAFAAHPGLAAANLGKIPSGAGAMRNADRFLGLLRAGNLPDQVVAYAMDILMLYATSYAYEQGIYASRMTEEEGAAHLQQVSDYFASMPADRFPNIAALRKELFEGSEGDERFEFGLDMLVTGLAAQARP
jgi:AcrR family transcriptional regulator